MCHPCIFSVVDFFLLPTLDCQRGEVTAQSDWTVGRLKEELEEKFPGKIPASLQRLFKGTHLLPSGMTLEEASEVRKKRLPVEISPSFLFCIDRPLSLRVLSWTGLSYCSVALHALTAKLDAMCKAPIQRTVGRVGFPTKDERFFHPQLKGHMWSGDVHRKRATTTQE